MRVVEQTCNAVRRLPPRGRLSIPGPQRTLLGNTKQWAEPLLAAHEGLQTHLLNRVGGEVCASAYREDYSFPRHNGLRLNDEITTKLYSAALILNWVVGRTLGALTPDASLSDAEVWFHGGNSPAVTASNKLDAVAQNTVLSPLRGLEYGPQFLDILPYACEVFETSDELLKAFGPSRKSKRAAGIFYTPSDVADYIVEKTLSLQSRSTLAADELTWLDPACGTACLLLSALYKISEVTGFESSEDALAYAAGHLFGIDVSPLALQSAVYVLVAACVQGGLPRGKSLRECLRRVGCNLSICDSTTLSTHEDLSGLLPALDSGAACVVSNPPYIRGLASQNAAQPRLFVEDYTEQKDTQSLYPTFVHLLPTLSDGRHGSGGMVVPLSIAYSTHQEFKNLRRFMSGTDGSWHLIHFDRTPDSLFGDDVKTRNTIVFFAREEAGSKALYTSDLIRWSSRSRAELFKSVSLAQIHQPYTDQVIPKIGDDFGQAVLRIFMQRDSGMLGQFIKRATDPWSAPENCLRNASTAYNWLPFERLTDVAQEGTKYHYWAARSAGEASAAFALAQSRVAYWLWRAWGDGFHLTDQFIKSLPLSFAAFSATALCQLKELGDKLWSEMLENKVTTRNAGVVSLSYCPYVSQKLLDQIDELIASAYDLPTRTTQYLRDVVWRTVVAGREDEMSSNPALRRWMSGGTK